MEPHSIAPDLHNDHNVYILGAGFSTLSGLPLVRDFLNRMRDAVDVLEGTDRVRERKAISNVLAFRLKAAAAAHRTKINVENVEELFSLASAMDQSSLNEDMMWAIAATLDYCAAQARDKLRTVSFPSSLCAKSALRNWTQTEDSQRKVAERDRPYWSFRLRSSDIAVANMLGLLRPGAAEANTFISFNYDLVLEEAVKKLGLKLSYGIPDDIVDSQASYVGPDAVCSLLKLHGSMNWVSTEKPGEIRICEDYDVVRQLDKPPVLVPPTWRKEFGVQLTHVWSHAVKALQTATRIIVIGFSMPRTDIHVRYLLGAGLRDNVSLRRIVFVDPNHEGIARRVFQILRAELYKQGVLRFDARDASKFLIHESGMVDIGRGIDRINFE